MSLVSFSFLVFVAIVLTLYFAVPKKVRWIVLLVASLAFYWMNSTWLVFVLIATSLATYLFGLLLQHENDRHQQYLQDHAELSKEEKKELKAKLKKKNRLILSLGILLVLGSLLFLKYYNFFGDSLNRLLNRVGSSTRVPILKLLLPLGISFYTLQSISYLTDIYRGKVTADRNPAKFLLFMSFFPQIVQGPIPRYNQLANQLYEGHSFDFQRLCSGAQLMLWGFIKKLVIAERISIPVGYLFGHFSGYTGPVLFFAAALYGFQVYADFSGGIDIARGVGEMLGINLTSNFAQPYHATSIEDFWRRWHITMGSWMKDYIFYPLSLSKAFANFGKKSRKLFGQYFGKRLPAFLAMFIVYFCVGFWHGANWKYLAYGVWNGTFIMISILLENVYAKGRKLFRIDEKTVTWRVFRMLRTFVIVSFGRFFSRSLGLFDALKMFGRMFTDWRNITFLTNGTLLDTGLSTANWFVLLFSIIILLYVDCKHEHGVSFRRILARQHLIFRWIILIGAILIVLVFGYYGPAYNAESFVYAQF